MSELKITVDGAAREVPSDTTGFKLFESKSIVALRVNGELKDLAYTVVAGDVVEGVELSSPDGLNILRHSAAHVLAQAVQNINPEAKLGIGPPIKDGFYYDFDVVDPFTPEDLRKLELDQLNDAAALGNETFIKFFRGIEDLSDKAAKKVIEDTKKIGPVEFVAASTIDQQEIAKQGLIETEKVLRETTDSYDASVCVYSFELLKFL